MGNFLGDCCTFSEGARVASTLLYRAYEEYALEAGVTPKTQAAFGRELNRRNIKKGNSGGRYREGIALRPAAMLGSAAA